MLYQIFTNILAMGMTASVVITAVLFIRCLMYRLPAKYRYLLWLIAGIRLICPIAAASPASLFNIINPGIKADLIYNINPADAQPSSSLHSQNKLPKTHIQNSNINPAGYADAKPAQNIPADKQTFGRHQQILPMLKYGAAIWLAGMTVMLLWNFQAAARMRHRIKNAVRYRDNIYECGSIPSPFVIGIAHAKIYIPFRLEHEEREYILQHEQYHIKRKDYLIKITAVLLTCIYWFHPLVWLSYYYINQDMEMSCDEYVLQHMTTDIRTCYSRSLLEFAANQRDVTAGMLPFGESYTRKRVKNVLKFKKQGKWAGITAAALIIITGTVCLTDAMHTKTSPTTGLEDTNTADTKAAGTKITNTENIQLSNESRKDNLQPNASHNDNMQSNISHNDNMQPNVSHNNNLQLNENLDHNLPSDETYEAIVAEALIHGYQVRIACLFDHAKDPVQSKQDLEFGLYRGNFEIQTYKNNTKHASFQLQTADEIYFPADGFPLAVQDYDGDGDADDFALGQGQTPYPLLGNYMSYYFFTINEDGTIAQHALSTQDGQSLTTIPGDFSKEFPCKDGIITYLALGENGTKEQTASIIQ